MLHGGTLPRQDRWVAGQGNGEAGWRGDSLPAACTWVAAARDALSRVGERQLRRMQGEDGGHARVGRGCVRGCSPLC